MLHVFAYGSNMCTQRIGARVAAADPIATGYVTHRRIAFHKSGIDGSAKADAAYTGCAADRVWGVVFRLPDQDKPKLDACESGYDDESIVVVAGSRLIAAQIYTARAESIDESLLPFTWYHRFVIHGARQHRLPDEYIRQLQAIASVADLDCEREQRNSRIIAS